ncbi:hypothetical protein [Aquimarina sp. 2304DJ70-9]
MKTLKNIKKRLQETKQKQTQFLGFTQSGHDYEYHIRIRPNLYIY